MNYRDTVAERAHLKGMEDDLRRKIHNLPEKPDPCLQFTLASGTRCTITGLLDDRLQITSFGGNPWAEKEGSSFLTLGMLSIDDLGQLLEIRTVIEAWRRGSIDELPMPRNDFGPWICPPEFKVLCHT